jgi:hypothetical protein
VTVQIKLSCFTKAKDLEVAMDSQSIRVIRKATKEVIIEGEFYDAIRLEDSAWSIEEGLSLHLNLEKSQREHLENRHQGR